MDIEESITVMQEEKDRLAREKLALQDQLDDLMSGFEFWKEHKTASMELTTLDEMFLRWVEHAKGN